MGEDSIRHLNERLTQMHKDDRDDHAGINKKLDGLIRDSSQTGIAVGRLEERTKTLHRDFLTLSGRVDTHGVRLDGHDRHNAEERGQVKKMAAGVGAALAGGVAVIVEVIRRLSGGG